MTKNPYRNVRISTELVDAAQDYGRKNGIRSKQGAVEFLLRRALSDDEIIRRVFPVMEVRRG